MRPCRTNAATVPKKEETRAVATPKEKKDRPLSVWHSSYPETSVLAKTTWTDHGENFLNDFPVALAGTATATAKRLTER
jgi:hypothetical protein